MIGLSWNVTKNLFCENEWDFPFQNLTVAQKDRCITWGVSVCLLSFRFYERMHHRQWTQLQRKEIGDQEWSPVPTLEFQNSTWTQVSAYSVSLPPILGSVSLYGQLNSITHYVHFCGYQKSCGEQIAVNISLVCFSLFIYAHITLLDS